MDEDDVGLCFRVAVDRCELEPSYLSIEGPLESDVSDLSVAHPGYPPSCWMVVGEARADGRQEDGPSRACSQACYVPYTLGGIIKETTQDGQSK